MSFFSSLFAKGEDPLPVIDDPQLGRMAWSKDDEAWVGTHKGLHFAIGYERQASPTPRLLEYAKDVLAETKWLMTTLEEEKKDWLPKIPPSAKDELAALKFGLISFSMRENGGYIFAVVEGGADNRSWRIEYRGRECDGLGFDT